jgi:hypothetical protein
LRGLVSQLYEDMEPTDSKTMLPAADVYYPQLQMPQSGRLPDDNCKTKQHYDTGSDNGSHPKLWGRKVEEVRNGVRGDIVRYDF